MSVHWLVALAALSSQSGLRAIEARLDVGDFRGAWEELSTEPDGLGRWVGRAAVLYRAGDPAGALLAARAGLAVEPSDLDLLYYAAGSAIWLEDPIGATEYSRRLRDAVTAIGDDRRGDRAAWSDVAGDFASRSQTIVRREQALARDMLLFKLLSTGTLLVVLLGVPWLGKRAQGRSRRPVS